MKFVNISFDFQNHINIKICSAKLKTSVCTTKDCPWYNVKQSVLKIKMINKKVNFINCHSFFLMLKMHY